MVYSLQYTVLQKAVDNPWKPCPLSTASILDIDIVVQLRLALRWDSDNSTSAFSR